MNKLITDYDKAKYFLCYEFAKRYFEEDELTDADFSSEHGCIFLNEGELVFSIDDVYQCIKHDIGMDVMVDWFDYCLDCSLKDKERGTNLYNFWRYKTVSKEQLEKERLEGIEKAKSMIDKSAQYFADELGIDKEELLKSFNEK